MRPLGRAAGSARGGLGPAGFALVLAALSLFAHFPARAAETQPPTAPDPFAHWAAVVIAGDHRAAGGGATQGFDNARRDVAAAFERAGFDPDNVAELSAQPRRYPKETLERSGLIPIASELQRVAARATAGCLFYLTTHGSELGAPVGRDLLTPIDARKAIQAACGARPTVVIISACFSGVFVTKLAAPNRMVLTAARPDRTSFGCGQNDRYPYFDDCLLKSMPQARDFLALADATRACVAARERAEHLSPPSEPQLFVGAAIEPLLKADAFLKPGAPSRGSKPPA